MFMIGGKWPVLGWLPDDAFAPKAAYLIGCENPTGLNQSLPDPSAAGPTIGKLACRTCSSAR